DRGGDGGRRVLPLLALLRLRPAGGLAPASAARAEAGPLRPRPAASAAADRAHARPSHVPRPGGPDPPELRLGGQREGRGAHPDRGGDAARREPGGGAAPRPLARLPGAEGTLLPPPSLAP